MNRNRALLFLISALFIGAGAVRLTDLTDEPLDFNPTRQLYNAIVARAIYYTSQPDTFSDRATEAAAQRERLERLEPPIVPALAALGYRLTGGERSWIGRLISIAAWLAAGWLVVSLGKKLGAGYAGVAVGSAYFLFLPLGIYGSRSFQVDPAMVMALAFSLYALTVWMADRSWKWALITGAAAGLAVLLKGVGALILGPVLAVAIWETASVSGQPARERFRRVVTSPQVWALLALSIGPGLFYYAGLDRGVSILLNRSGLNRPDTILSPSFYIRWLILADRTLSAPVIFAAFGSAWLAPGSRRNMLLGLWAGYGLYGLAFPDFITTHDYYHLPLVLIVSVSLIPAADLVAGRLLDRGLAGRTAFAGLLLLSSFYPAWVSRSVLLAEDFRAAGDYWTLVGEEIPADGRAVGYSQDYGYRLMYYGWRSIGVLPEGISAVEFESRYAGADYFVVTARNQMSADLAGHLEAAYPVIAQGGGYAVYDLKP